MSRTEAEARCQGNAAWSDNSTTDIYLRAYRQGENTMVAYSATGFDAAGAAQNAQAPQAPSAQGVPGYDQRRRRRRRPASNSRGSALARAPVRR